MSWKAEIQVAGDPKWYDNAVRFATKREAEQYAEDLYQRWTTAKNWRAAKADDPVTASWVGGGLLWKNIDYKPTTVDDHEL